MEEFANVFAYFVKYWWMSVTFHAAIHFPIWLMKGGHWSSLWAGPDR